MGSELRHCQVKTEDFPLPKNNTIDVTVLQITLSLSSMALASSFCLPLSAFVERRRIRPIETEQGQSLFDFFVTTFDAVHYIDTKRVELETMPVSYITLGTTL